MRIRELLTVLLFLAVAVVHFGLQWYGWRLHLREVGDAAAPLVSSGDPIWRICSFPLFAWVPRRFQNLYFLEILFANSLIWGGTVAWANYMILTILNRGRRSIRPSSRKQKPDKPSLGKRTETDRLVELKHLLDQGLITQEEYREKRAAILVKL
jgi:hypothetical protein